MNSLPFVPELAYVSTRSFFSWKLIACVVGIAVLIGIIIYRYVTAQQLDEAKPECKLQSIDIFPTELRSTISQRPTY